MPFTLSANDLFSLFYAFGGLRALTRLFRNWRAFWDNQVTATDRALAGDLALFVLVPLGVLLHQLAMAATIRYFGANVIVFQWHVVWGIVLPDQDFPALQGWIIALSGNAVSIMLGLLVIPLLPVVRRAIVGELLYRFAWHELFYALVWFPALSVVGFGGEWTTIYNFAIAPYAQFVLGLHLALLVGLWLLDHSARAARWRIGRDAEALAALRGMEARVRGTEATAESLAALAYFCHYHNENGLSRSYEKQAEQLSPRDPSFKTTQAMIAYDRKQYRKAQANAQFALESGATTAMRPMLHRILALSAVSLGQRAEALDQFDAALSLLPEDYDLYLGRGQLKRSMGRSEEAWHDFQQAVRFAQDDDERKQAQNAFEHTH